MENQRQKNLVERDSAVTKTGVEEVELDAPYERRRGFCVGAESLPAIVELEAKGEAGGNTSGTNCLASNLFR